MYRNLIKFRKDLEDYLNAETPYKQDYVRGLQTIDLSRIGEPYDIIMTEIPEKRAIKLRRNIQNHRQLSNFHYSFHLKKDVIKFILGEFTGETKLIWDIIEIPQTDPANPSDPIITFALGKEGKDQRWLVLDVDQPVDITSDFKTYEGNFLNSTAKILDRCFIGNGFAAENTRSVHVKNDASFKKLCDAALQQKDYEMYLETCIISLDIVDLITGTSPYNFFNVGQFSFFEKVIDTSGTVLFSNIVRFTENLHGDVNPTRPPY